MSQHLAFKPPRTKADRQLLHQRNEQLLPSAALPEIRHYARVKHHQARKRLNKKRK